ncbi:MAG: MBL fold metallo-hydrolase [Gemmatimonadota bacterium]|nr:MBL fold metallo-hydrolase [Gemmatimonadota bacterium]
MKIHAITVGPFEENCYLVVDEGAGEAVLVDPGDEPGRVVEMAERAGVAPSAVWLTHAHLDHIGAVEGVRRRWPGIPVFLHPADAPVYAYAETAARQYGVPFEQPGAPDRAFADHDAVRVGSVAFDVLHVPGHAPGHVALVGPGIVFGGDCLFAGSVGRTDLPLCEPAVFVDSLERLLELPDATIVYPGHGPHTSIGRERATNPFITGAIRIPGTARAIAGGRHAR